MTYLEPECIQGQKYVPLMQKYWFQNFTLFDLSLTSSKVRLRVDVVGSMTIAKDIYVQDDPENVCPTVWLWVLFFTEHLCPHLDLNKLRVHDLRTLLVFYIDPNNIFGEFELFVARLTDTSTQNVKTLYFVLWPELTWHLALFLER